MNIKKIFIINNYDNCLIIYLYQLSDDGPNKYV